MEDNSKKLTLEIKPEIARGDYSNLAIITHSRSEFVIDFAAMLPGLAKPEVIHRILMTPDHAKRLLNALQDNIIKYENQFGIIDVEGARSGGGTFNLGDLGNFGGPKS